MTYNVIQIMGTIFLLVSILSLIISFAVRGKISDYIMMLSIVTGIFGIVSNYNVYEFNNKSKVEVLNKQLLDIKETKHSLGEFTQYIFLPNGEFKETPYLVKDTTKFKVAVFDKRYTHDGWIIKERIEKDCLKIIPLTDD
jgi:hypothetical protein